MSTEANCKHQWWVYSTAISDPPKILVQCRLCKVLGSTEHYIKEEWERAYYAPSEPFEWEGTVEHIGIHDNKRERRRREKERKTRKLAEGIPAPEDEMAADQKVLESFQTHNDQIIELIEKSDDMFFLSGLKRHWEARMKALAAERLKPDSDEVIEDMNALDHLWELRGDYVIDSEKIYHPYALDYYLGRTVSHVWGEGKIVRFIKSDEEMLTKEREHFGDNLIVSDEFRNRGYHYGIALKYPCNCGKVEYDMYAIPGVYTGGFAYLIIEGNENLFDVRNHCMTCDDCEKKVAAKLEEIDKRNDASDKDKDS